MKSFLLPLTLIAVLLAGFVTVRFVLADEGCGVGPDPDDVTCNQELPCQPCYDYASLVWEDDEPPLREPSAFVEDQGGTIVEVGDGDQKIVCEDNIYCYAYGFCDEDPPVTYHFCSTEHQPIGCDLCTAKMDAKDCVKLTNGTEYTADFTTFFFGDCEEET